MWITENDKEVECFHPVCADALQHAMDEIGLSDTYIIQHHRYTGSLEMDLVIANKQTNKIWCVIEVKRTIPAVYSSRYQYQAMSYVQSLRDNQKETNYYILTNLECSCLFKYSANRPNVYDQILEPGIIFNHKFDELPEDQFREDLKYHYRDLLMRIIDGYHQYVLSFSDFALRIQESMDNVIKWNTSLAYLFYEYIRGSFKSINRPEFHDISVFRNNIISICLEASKVNFRGIFGLPQQEYDSTFSPPRRLQQELYSLGKNYGDADAICNVMHSVISYGHEHEGEVATDIELAQTLMSLVHLFTPTLSSDDIIGDLAAGSGTLLSAALSAFPTIKPHQLYANDINRNLLQLLTLRLGLIFADCITREEFPIINVNDIATINPDDLTKIRVLVLNPPYLSATANNCITRKASLCNRINDLTGHQSVTSVGQASLECPFIELMTAYAKDGTVMACIIPNTHLTAQGSADVAFRKFLLDDFGLRLVFTYPQSSLFENVAQNTSIIIGIKNLRSDNIYCIQSLRWVSEINNGLIKDIDFSSFPSDAFIEIMDGIQGRQFTKEELLRSNNDGWNFLDSIILEGISFCNTIIKYPKFIGIDGSAYSQFRRGKVGNIGGNDLVFISSIPDFYNEVQGDIIGHLAAGMRNADYSNFLVGRGDCVFLDVTQLSDSKIAHIATVYYNNFVRDGGRQRRDQKSIVDYINILKSESTHYVSAFSVLLPRASRRKGSVYVCTERTFISTNFMAIPTSDLEEAKIIGSWMSTIFYQIELETVSKNHNGMRKIERVNIDRTHIPNIQQLSSDEVLSIVNTPIDSFIDLRTPIIRDIDRKWAQVITGKENNEDLLNEAVIILTMLSNNRED